MVGYSVRQNKCEGNWGNGDVLIRLSSNEKVCQFIDIVVAYIPDAYGLVLSWDQSAKINGYFASDWSHLWFPHKGSPNQTQVLREPHMKHNVTQLEEKNEPVNSVQGNYFIELEPGNYQAEEASIHQTPTLISFDFHGLMRLTVKQQNVQL